MHPYRHAPQTGYTPGELAWFRKPLVLALLALGACVNLPHVEPRTRFAEQRRATAVAVESTCDNGLSYMYPAGEGHNGQGVIISERHVLTAAHVVACARIPKVVVTLSDGQRHRMVVTREDEDLDIARLEVWHAGRFGLDIPPPVLAGHTYMHPEYLCVERQNEPAECGVRMDRDHVYVHLEHGDSGAGVYRLGSLVGIVIQDLPFAQGGDWHHATRMSIVDASWLEGT